MSLPPAEPAPALGVTEVSAERSRCLFPLNPRPRSCRVGVQDLPSSSGPRETRESLRALTQKSRRASLASSATGDLSGQGLPRAQPGKTSRERGWALQTLPEAAVTNYGSQLRFPISAPTRGPLLREGKRCPSLVPGWGHPAPVQIWAKHKENSAESLVQVRF